MSSYYNKNNNLVKYGIIGELIVKFYLENMKEETFLLFNHNDEYDLKTNKGTYEIKTDFNYLKYNSVLLEFESNEKPSGIETSKSKNYIFVCPNNKQFDINIIFEIETNKLKEIINKKPLIIKNAPCKDYYNNLYSINKGYIIPEKYLLKYSTRYEINLSDFEPLQEILKNI